MTNTSVQNQAIKNIVIVGGDTIGWTVAMGLARGLQGQQANIILVDEHSPEKPHSEPAVINASHHIHDFHQSMGINEPYLLAQGHGQLTCARQYINWLTDRPDFFIGNNTFQPAFNNIALHHLLSSAGIKNVSDYSFAAQMALQSKAICANKESNTPFGNFNTGMLLNTQEYKRFIQGAALHLGVKVIHSALKQVELSKGSDFVSEITLANGQKLPVDLVVDNSGAYSKIMQAVLGVNYQDESIPFNTLLVLEKSASNSDSSASNYTKVIANNHGWVEQCTLNGTQYYAQLCANATDDSALTNDFLATIGVDAAHSNKITKHKVRFGKSERFFHKNCVVIGAAAGYLSSPTISTLVLAQRAVSRLLDLFPTKACFVSTANEYNRLTHKDYDEAADFLMLHLYLASTNEQAKRYAWSKSNNTLSNKLQQKIALFESYGRYEDELNAMIISTTWIDLLSQCCRNNAAYEPLLKAFDNKEIALFLGELKRAIDEQVNKLPLLSI